MPLILIVDDDDDAAEIYGFVLSAAGFRTARATNGAEGLTLEEELSPDLILLDVNMPILDGLEMLRRRDPARRARTPVIGEFGRSHQRTRRARSRRRPLHAEGRVLRRPAGRDST